MPKCGAMLTVLSSLPIFIFVFMLVLPKVRLSFLPGANYTLICFKSWNKRN